MIVKRDKKPSYILIFLIILIASYFTLRVTTLMEQNGGKFNVDYLNITLDNLYKLATPLIITKKTVSITLFVSVFLFVLIYSYISSQKKNMQENTYGSSDWEDSKNIKQFKQIVDDYIKGKESTIKIVMLKEFSKSLESILEKYKFSF